MAGVSKVALASAFLFFVRNVRCRRRTTTSRTIVTSLLSVRMASTNFVKLTRNLVDRGTPSDWAMNGTPSLKTNTAQSSQSMICVRAKPSSRLASSLTTLSRLKLRSLSWLFVPMATPKWLHVRLPCRRVLMRGFASDSHCVLEFPCRHWRRDSRTLGRHARKQAIGK